LTLTVFNLPLNDFRSRHQKQAADVISHGQHGFWKRVEDS